jgi:Domain of unknown function (DUF4976)
VQPPRPESQPGHTYVDIVGAKRLPYADGQSLRPLFTDPDSPAWTDQILYAYYGSEFLYTQRIAITDRFKYVFNGFDIDELYDLERDPREMRNLPEDRTYATYTDDMRARLYEMMACFEDSHGYPEQWTAPGNPPDRYCGLATFPAANVGTADFASRHRVDVECEFHLRRRSFDSGRLPAHPLVHDWPPV